MNIHNIKFNRRELSGSLADIGIFMPLALGLININGLNPFTIFFIGGLLYIAAGIYYGHPVSVQPLKALAVTSLAMGASINMISAASILMGVILILIYFTGIAHILLNIFQKPIVRGLQFGLGLMLVKKGVEFILSKEFLIYGREIVLSFKGRSVSLGIIVGAISAGYIIKFYKSKKIPASLVIIGFGVMLGLITMPDRFLTDYKIKTSAFPVFNLPDTGDLLPALFLLVIPQLPLTIGNALFASSDTAKSYFGKAADKTNPASLSLGLGIINILAGLSGGMPLCHGAGGLTAHYRFGARTSGSNIIIGVIFISIAMISLYIPVSFLYLIPVSTMGSLLIYTGITHAMLIEDTLNNKNELLITMLIGSIAIVTSNLFIGCVWGLTANLWLNLKLGKYEITTKPYTN